ncbi:MAG: hypothetical protein HY999_06045 [Nitrospinae bacterium]|nr:hypothetical protein [Nitrospinota bacterium]
MDREELTGLIGNSVGRKTKIKRSKVTSESGNEPEPTPPPEPLQAEPEVFWGKDIVQDNILGQVLIPQLPAVLVRRLGNFPFWRSEENFLEIMQSIYSTVSSQGLEVFLGERSSKRDG